MIEVKAATEFWVRVKSAPGAILAITGEVKVLLVKVSVVALPT